MNPPPGYIFGGADMRSESERAQDEADEAELIAHEDGECLGAPRCLWCVLDKQTADESLGGCDRA